MYICDIFFYYTQLYMFYITHWVHSRMHTKQRHFIHERKVKSLETLSIYIYYIYVVLKYLVVLLSKIKWIYEFANNVCLEYT